MASLLIIDAHEDDVIVWVIAISLCLVMGFFKRSNDLMALSLNEVIH